MDGLNTILWSLSRGLLDSLKGSLVLFYIDKDIKEKVELRLQTYRQKSPSKVNLSSQNKSSKSNNEEPKVLKRTVQCCALNGGIFLLSILIFEYGLLPLLSNVILILLGKESAIKVWYWLQMLLSCTFGTLWVLPLFVLSKVVNGLWFMDIADQAYRHSRGRPLPFHSVSRSIADFIFSILVQALFLVQAVSLSWLPWPLGLLLSQIHIAMLYSLYGFEYKWVNMGWELHKRLTFIENNWPYFIGFGLPLALLTSSVTSYIVSGCIFSILFPLFIVSANEADPVIGVPDFPLQLFSPVIAISNGLFNRTIVERR